MCRRPSASPPGAQVLLLLLPLLLLASTTAAPSAAPAGGIAVRSPPRGGTRPHYMEAVRPVLVNGAMPSVDGHGQQPVQELAEMVPAPRKRAAIVLDKLMFALQKALDDTPPPAPGPPPPPTYPRSRTYAGTMDLQRRGNGDGRLYWRCYFNAVSCF